MEPEQGRILTDELYRAANKKPVKTVKTVLQLSASKLSNRYTTQSSLISTLGTQQPNQPLVQNPLLCCRRL